MSRRLLLLGRVVFLTVGTAVAPVSCSESSEGEVSCETLCGYSSPLR